MTYYTNDLKSLYKELEIERPFEDFKEDVLRTFEEEEDYISDSENVYITEKAANEIKLFEQERQKG